jgi:filamentous hemagglutinin family protein
MVDERVGTRPLKTAWIICAVLCAIVVHISAGLAQTATPIIPSGLNTQVNLSATPPDGKVQHDITGGTRAGTNLFHSFGDFNVPHQNIANFLNNTGLATENILSRVTGGNVSSIFGSIQTTGFGDANLFLMNPAGIVFGPNASLNVGGSVTFTTADYLRFQDDGRFNAIPNATADALLSMAPVAAYGFMGSNPGAITVQGSQFTVSEKHGISLVGGNITIQNGTLENGAIQPARLSAPNGQINLATTQSPGEFLQDFSVAANINQASFTSFGYAHLESGSTVDISQTGNGKVSIRGGQLILEIQNSILSTTDNAAPTPVVPGQDTIALAPRSEIISETSSADPGPNIHLNSDRITLIGVPSDRENFNLKPFTGIQSYTEGVGNAGDIILQATKDIEITKVVALSSLTAASGHAGNIELTSAHGNIRMTEGGKESSGSSTTISNGKTGNVTVSAPEGDIVLDGASLFTLSQGSPQQETGRPGQVEIIAKNLQMSAGTLGNFTTGPAKPGGITVKLSGTLTMAADPSLVLPPRVFPDSLIVTSSVSQAPAGDINITAKDIVVTQGSLINSAAFASGLGGHIKIVADTLQVTDGGQLSSGSTRAPDRGTLPQNITPTGRGGDITIRALGPTGSVLVNGAGSGIFADTEGTGAGGTIDLSARSLTIQNGGTISASSTGSGNAGDILIDAGQQLELLDRSSITTTTQSAKANGGNIDIQAIERVRLVNSTISTSVKGDEGGGGNIFIDPNVVVLQSSNVTAQAVGGAGGNITITTPLFLADSTSLVSASSQKGINGTVTIQSPTSNLSGSLGSLTSKPSQTQALLTQRCSALVNGQASSFVVAGREQLPSNPGGWLTSLPALAALGENLDADNAVASISTIMAIAADNTSTVSLRRLTPAGFLMANFAESEATGCRS